MLGRRFLSSVALVFAFTACGGGGTGSSPMASEAPVLAGVQVSAINAEGTITLTASVTDAVPATGYCYLTTSETPDASSECFHSDSRTRIGLKQTAQTWFVWAKSAAGRVSLASHVLIAADTSPPSMTGLTSTVFSNGDVTLNASAADGNGVSGYCFKTGNIRPVADDACFTGKNSFTVGRTEPATLYFVWAKDFAGNISASREQYAGCSPSASYAAQQTSLPCVCVSTSEGDFVLALEDSKAPNTVVNFLRYVNEGYYSGTIFHRVISTFMVQGGGYTSPNARKAGASTPIALESTQSTGLLNTIGTVAMARQDVPTNSATTEFFINVVDNPFLNYTSASSPGYAVFGRVIYGLDTTVQTIRQTSVQSNGSEESEPIHPPVINWMYRIK